MPVKRILPAIQHYAWGTKESIPELLGKTPDGRPWAEAWYGSHPSAPSTYEDGSPLEIRLPFLLKILSAEIPLSIQAHPSKKDAERLYAKGKLPDSNHKPETIVALKGGMEARAGVRDASVIDRIINRLGVPTLARIWAHPDVSHSSNNLLVELLTMTPSRQARVIAAVLESVQKSDFISEFPEDHYWTTECANIFTPNGETPHDIGIIIQLLMNYVSLAPGEGLHMPANELHAYLRGTGIEVMANSDNVLRAGLTPKPLAIEELIELGCLEPTAPRTCSSSTTRYEQADIADYSLQRVTEEAEGLTDQRPTIILSLGRCILSDGEHSLLLEEGASTLTYSSDIGVTSLSGQSFIATGDRS